MSEILQLKIISLFYDLGVDGCTPIGVYPSAALIVQLKESQNESQQTKIRAER
jgi:hypothetical protein